MRRRFLGLLLLGLLLPLPVLTETAAEDRLHCAVCGKSIEGKYIEDQGEAYHRECYEQYRAPRCAACGKAILGSRIDFEGKSYHEECYRESAQPRCDACGKPIEGTYIVASGKKYHPACHRGLAVRCVVCGEPLEKSYLEDGWGNAFHARHGKESLCPFCGRVMALSTTHGSFLSTANGIRICALCARRAVSRRDEVAAILERVRVRLQEIFPVPPGSFSWELVDRDHLMRRLSPGRFVGNELGITVGEFRRSGRAVSRRVSVALLTGVPDWLLAGVAAHELAHVWQQLHDLSDLPPDQAEGSAEYAAYLLLEEAGTEEGRVKIEAMKRSEDPAYGAGFRRALEIAHGQGSAAGLRKALQGGKGWSRGS
ncbi:MAG TPA: LIM domain-containing protein [Candidatus Polarisedimenticolia bacterium]|jgi:hypothetical protein|nr:LIM domain-containing protein [Candidatus Polarisedimenticolia bacterium]